jgi:hypothetical protein
MHRACEYHVLRFNISVYLRVEIMEHQQLNQHEGGLLDDLVPAGRGDAMRNVDDPFALLRHTGTPMPHLPSQEVQDAMLDPLAQLQREAEAVLRNPELTSTYRQSALVERSTALPEADTPSKHPWAGTDGDAGSLLDLLSGPSGINDLIGTMDSLDTRRLLTPPTTPDVLLLFAGDIGTHQRHGMTAALTRREHHLVSMDSAYLPAAQAGEEQP